MGSDFGDMPYELKRDILSGKYPDAARFLTAGRGLAPFSEIDKDNMRHAAYVVLTEEGARAEVRELASRGVTLVISETSDSVRDELDRYGVTALLGTDASYPTVAEAVTAFEQQQPD